MGRCQTPNPARTLDQPPLIVFHNLILLIDYPKHTHTHTQILNIKAYYPHPTITYNIHTISIHLIHSHCIHHAIITCHISYHCIMLQAASMEQINKGNKHHMHLIHHLHPISIIAIMFITLSTSKSCQLCVFISYICTNIIATQHHILRGMVMFICMFIILFKRYLLD